MKQANSLPNQSIHFHSTVEFYNTNAHELTAKYEALTFEQVHSHILEYLPASPAVLLDVGAGSGRDASALAERGYEVVAVEPSRAFREIGKRLHPSPRVAWLDDTLPELELVVEMHSNFDAILCSAVWMHLDGQGQARAMHRLASLVASSGRLFVTFRTRAINERPGVFDTTATDVARQARAAGLRILHNASMPDIFQRPGVEWHSVSLEKLSSTTRTVPALD